MEPWHRRLPRRLLREFEAADQAALQLRFEHHPDDVLKWRGTIDVDGQHYFLEVEYPQDFPARPPRVLEMEPFTRTPIQDNTAKLHRFNDGSLCLFAMGSGPDVWSPRLTIVDVVERYREFRRVAGRNGHSNEHGIPVPDVPGVRVPVRLVLTPGQAQVLRAPQGWGWVTTCERRGDTIVVAHIMTGDGSIALSQDLGPWGIAHSPQDGGRFPWIRVTDARLWQEQFPDVGHLSAALMKHIPPAGQSQVPPSTFVLVSSEISPTEVRAILLERGLEDSWLRSYPVEIFHMHDAIFRRVDDAMDDRQALDRFEVAVVGLGSLGASATLHLARAGVTRFHLFDPDVVKPENVCRHPADLDHIHRLKVDVVDQLIHARNPRAAVCIHDSSPLCDGRPRATLAFEELLANPDALVIVATADDSVERAINDLAILHRTPVVYGSVLGPGLHGRVFRVLPGETACYQCVLDQQIQSAGRYFRYDPAPGDARRDRDGYQQPGIPGVGIDVEMVALMVARLALQTLSRLGNGRPAYPDAPGHHMVWTNRGGDGFDMALQTRWESYQRSESCEACRGAGSGISEEQGLYLRELERRLSAPERLAPNFATLNRGVGRR